MVKLIQLIIPCTIITLSTTTITGDDITTIAEFEAYNRMTRNVCSGDDVSTCPKPSRSVCLNDYCYKTCTKNKDCAKKFMCSYENLCKPKGCHPCISGPTYPITSSTTRDPDTTEEPELEIDASSITTVDEWEDYMRKADAYCPSGDVSECGRQKRRICLDGKCFKKCKSDNGCADGFTCNFEGLCKPANCTPCIRRTMMPTSAMTVPIEDLLDDEIVPDITTESEFDAYMARTRRVCPGGDVRECPVKRNRICLAGKCFKKCGDDDDCGDKFVCNFENLCKPANCTRCQRATYYPTSQPPSDDILAVLDEEMGMDGKNQVFSTAIMVSITSFVGVIIFIFWICGGCMLWKNGDNIKKIGEYEPSTKYGATASV